MKIIKYIKIIEKDFRKAIKDWDKQWTDCDCDNCLAEFLSNWFGKRPKTSTNQTMKKIIKQIQKATTANCISFMAFYKEYQKGRL